MITLLRALMVEDSEDDAWLLIRELEKGGYTVKSRRVETAKEMSEALKKQVWDIILADYSMPHFSGPDALKLLRQTGLDIPFIIVSGKVGEETAIELLLAGADDYILKTKLKRLVPAVQRELREAEIHRERKLAEEQIINQATFPQEDPNPVLRASREGIIIFNNKASTPLLLTWQTSMGKPIPKDWQRLVENVYKKQTNQTVEIDSQGHTYLLNIVAVTDKNYVNIYGTDITDLKSAETWVQHLNQVLLTIRKVNQLIVTTDDEKELLQKTCKAIAEGQNYKLARIGFIKEGSYDIQPMAQAGFARDYLDSLKVTWDDSEYGRSPSGVAIKTGKPAIVQDVIADENFQLWRDTALKFGFASVAALPLIIRNKTIGVLVVYSDKIAAFRDDEIELLKELAGDISLGIQKIRQQNEIKQANEKYAAVVENSNDGIIILQDGKLKFANANMDKMAGYATSENLGKPFIDFVSPEYRELGIERYRKRLAGEAVPSRYEIELITGDKKPLPVEVSAGIIEYEGKPADLAMIRDITERKQAEEKVRESEAKLRAIVTNAPLGIATSDTNRIFLSANNSFCKILGYTETELQKMSYKDITHPEDIEESEANMADLDENKLSTFSTEKRYIKKDGTVIFGRVIVNAIRSPEGKPNLFIAELEDITERKLAEEKLRESEAKHRLLFETMVQGVIYQDVSGEIISANPAAERILGLTIDQMQGRTSRDPRWRAIREDGSDFSGETHPSMVALKTGKQVGNTVMGVYNPHEEKYHWININAIPQFRPGEDKPYEVYTTFEDITERKQNEIALRESEARFKTVFQSSPAAIVITRLGDGRLIDFNHAWLEITGYEREEVTGKNTGQLKVWANPDDRDSLINMIREKGENRLETRIRRKTGEIRDILISGDVISIGDEPALVTIALDITERKRAEEQLKFHEQLLHAATDSIIVLDEKGNIAYFNEAAYHSLGYSREIFSKMHLRDLATPDYFSNISAQINKILDQQGEAVFEAKMVCQDKSIMPAEVHGRLIKLDGREYIINVIRDITQRKQAEEALRVSEENFHNSLAQSPLGIRILAPEGKALYSNKALLDMWGYSSIEELEAVPQKERYTPEDFIAYRERTARRQKGEFVPPEFEVNIKRKNGEVRTLSVRNRDVIWDGSPRQLVIYQDITERKKSEEALRDSEEKYHNLVERANDGICIIQDMNIVYSNEHLAQMWGGDVEDLTGKQFLEFVHPDSFDTVLNNYQQRMAGKNASSIYEVVLKRQDGNRLEAELNAGVIAYLGKPADLVFVRDITERKKAEEKLADSERALKAAQTLGKIGNWETDVATQQITWSDELYELYERDKTLGPPTTEEMDKFFSPVDNTKLKEAIQIAIETGQVFRADLTAHLPNGKTVFQHIAISPIKGENGKTTKLMGIIQDITERKLAEEQVKFQAELLDSAIDAVLVHDLQNSLIYANQAASQMYGYSPQEFFNATIDILLTKENRENIAENKQKVIAERQYNFETVHQRKNGSIIPVEVHSRTIEWGGKTLILSIVRDISGRKRAIQQLQDSEQQLKEAQALGRIANYEVDAETFRVVWSEQMYELFERDKHLPPPTVDEINKYFTPEEYAKFEMIRLTATNENRESHGDVIASLPSGKKPVFYISVRPVVNGDGKLIKTFGIIQDITVRKVAEEKLKESEQRLREAQKLGKIGNFELDIKTKKAIWSEEMFALLEREFTTEPILIDELFQSLCIQGSSVHSADEAYRSVEKTGSDTEDTSVILPSGKKVFFRIYSEAVKDINDNISKIIGTMQDITESKQSEEELQKSYSRLKTILNGIISAMAATIEIRDPYTSGHQKQVAMLAGAIAEEEGLPEETVNAIYTSGSIHDIGKIGIPADILSKPGRLNEIEFALIKAHPQIGFDVLKNIEFPYPMAQWVLEHHERMDGSGYPAGLKGEEISKEARILAVADVVESMVSHRPYRPGLGIDAALEEIRKGQGILYDTEAVEACIRLFKEKGFKLS